MPNPPLPATAPTFAWVLSDDDDHTWVAETDPELSPPFYVEAWAQEDQTRHRCWRWYVSISVSTCDDGPAPFYAEGYARDFDDAASLIRATLDAGWAGLHRWVRP